MNAQQRYEAWWMSERGGRAPREAFLAGAASERAAVLARIRAEMPKAREQKSYESESDWNERVFGNRILSDLLAVLDAIEKEPS